MVDGGATVPFIARYRKEVTGTLDDAQLRTLDERLRYLRELEERRAAILASVEEQGKLTGELRVQIDAEVEETIEAAVRFALDGPKPDPAAAAEYLYASGLRPRLGVAVMREERTSGP